jgi:NAD(P)H-hydrate epimerase
MRLVARCHQVRALDLALERELGLSPAELMEIAGAGCFVVARDAIRPPRRLVVVSGPGQNGGDGFVVARYALASGVSASCFALRNPVPGSASAIAFARLHRCGGTVRIGDLEGLTAALADPDVVVVDALFGTGLRFPLGPDAAAWVGAVAGARGAILAIDLPSGMDGDTGAAPSGSVRAARTLTIGAIKPGLLTPEGSARAGVVDLIPLPYPPDLVSGLERLEP